ncbi:Ycf51 family protein [Gloeocapsopsis crepidinum LEGE 06123]|uniref:Ycf51 family protein n=1 Tax=Gloeocapsopsis crepidinum LEGE 06123 TaxID=588587 RepID=A0ABR9URE9_9CHRO|nr:Ycf51 family protein [Gloeocapsopsis crepidinum]MBE9190863.1 Ycf51 family protein [Gloeocapsopsis crepidinum LEGE 06123]
MITTSEFFQLTQWAGIATLIVAVLAIAGFLFKWGVRFQLVGVTGFMAVLTGGLFALSLVPIMRTVIPGAVRFSVIYDNGATQAVIAVPPTITETELDATLRQAASDLFSYGRLGQEQDQLNIRARTIIHPELGVSQPLYLGNVKRSLRNREDEQIQIEIFSDKFAKLPKSSA